MSKLAVQHGWVELRAGDNYGKRYQGYEYDAAIRGFISRAPIGIWSHDGTSAYEPGHVPNAVVIGLLEHQMGMLTWDQWIAHRMETNSNEYAPEWTTAPNGAPDLAAALDALRLDFFEAHPPMTVQSAEESGMSLEPMVQTDEGFGERNRFVLAQSWWLASELIRRHPGLEVIEMHPCGGQYDVLCVSDPSEGEYLERTRIMLNRNGSIQIHYAPRSRRQDALIASWSEVFRSNDPHEHLKVIERESGFGIQGKAPKSTPKTLTFRLMASALSISLNSRAALDWRNEFLDTSGYGGGPVGYVELFPAAVAELEKRTRIEGEMAAYGFWALIRENVPVAIASDSGRLYLQDHVVNLRDAYKAHNRRIIPMAANLLEDLV